jgi:hypothetical protein
VTVSFQLPINLYLKHHKNRIWMCQIPILLYKGWEHPDYFPMASNSPFFLAQFYQPFTFLPFSHPFLYLLYKNIPCKFCSYLFFQLNSPKWMLYLPYLAFHQPPPFMISTFAYLF